VDSVADSPYIDTVILRFYPDNQTRRSAYDDGTIDGMHSVGPAYASSLSSPDGQVTTHQFNRVFSVFFNQNSNEALANVDVRKALAKAIPKSAVVESAVSGFGSVVSGPLPPSLAGPSATSSPQTSGNTNTPQDLLDQAGWTLDEGVRTKNGKQLTVNLTTVDTPTLTKAAIVIEDKLEQLGVNVESKRLAASELTRQVIRPRSYEALLFGQSVGSVRDLYPFWHSSRREDPGLNLAQYANSDVDQVLEQLRQATSSTQKTELRNQIVTTIKSEQPAAFVFSPSFIYVLPKKLQNTNIPAITDPADRFTNISDWYTETKTLWNTFVDKQ
jgi:peptide/nickel transport system substrate-binding protein